MKKLVSLLLAVVLCLSLTACGGSGKQPAIDAYNGAANAVNALIEIMNEDIDAYVDYVDTVNQIVADMNEVAEALENDELDQDTLDQLVTQCQTIEQLAVEAKAEIEG